MSGKLIKFWSLLITGVFFYGCQDEAGRFFSGRPSAMSMVHNQIIAGPSETMLELLKIPARFPDATEQHIAQWQFSTIAWWLNQDKHSLMLDSFSMLTSHEMNALQVWIKVRPKNQTENNFLVLDQIGVVLAGDGKSESP